MKKIGQITISGNLVNLYSDYEDAVSVPVVETPTSIVQTPTVTNQPSSISDLRISKDCIADNGTQKMISWASSVPTEVVLGSYIGTNYSLWIKPNTTWNITIREVNNHSNFVSYEVNSMGCGQEGIFKLLGQSATIPSSTSNTVVNTPVVAQITKNSLTVGNFAKIGELHTSFDKPIIHASSYNDSRKPQYYSVQNLDTGEFIFVLDAVDGYAPRIVYFGNHPIETRIPTKAGRYRFVFYDTADLPIIVGVTKQDGYTIYHGGLDSAMMWQRLIPNESTSFDLDIFDDCDKSYNKKTWDGKIGFSIDYTFYNSDGSYNVDKIEIENCPNGVMLEENKNTTLKFYKKIEPSKNITINFITGNSDSDAKYKVVEKNGLEINPEHFLVTCKNTTLHKVFNNLSSGYQGSPDYKEF